MKRSLRLIADIGGTNARFWLVDESGPVSTKVLQVSEFTESIALLKSAMKKLACTEVTEIRIAVAGRVKDGRAALTNSALVFDADALSKALAGEPKIILQNDLQAAALGLPFLKDEDSRPLGKNRNKPDTTQPLALITVGTGLGISGYFPGDSGNFVLATEGGHATLPATTDAELKIIQALAKRFGHVSGERVLSGSGLVVLYEVMTRANAPDPADIVDGALKGDLIKIEVLKQFCSFIGSVAGNLALTYGAWGGVFVGGGVPPRFADFLVQSPFRERFEAKGRFRSDLQDVPTRLILRGDIALLGLAEAWHPTA
tara:strand:- start:6690 stop:7634 length:945 start_codon:yes stop_codon:yes gene_type:complete